MQVDMRDASSIPGWEDPVGGWYGHTLLSGESHGQRSLVSYSPRGYKESDTTEVSELAHTHCFLKQKKTY